jgi:hypothetical protein
LEAEYGQVMFFYLSIAPNTTTSHQVSGFYLLFGVFVLLPPQLFSSPCARWDLSDFSSPLLLIEAGVGDAFSTLGSAHFSHLITHAV